VTQDELLTAPELAPELKLTVKQLYWMNHAGTGPPYLKIGRECRYRRSDVTAWLESRRVDSGLPAPS
jgi:predicted DNA-binding transcriptional regulator AlpA